MSQNVAEVARLWERRTQLRRNSSESRDKLAKLPFTDFITTALAVASPKKPSNQIASSGTLRIPSAPEDSRSARFRFDGSSLRER